jgi:hypothetical protein
MAESTALLHVTDDSPHTTALVRPIVTPAALVEAHKEVTDLVTQALQQDVDYGVIPGTGDKPTLLKPGAERLCKAFGLDPAFVVVEQEIDHDRVVAWTKRKKVWRNEYRGDKRYDWKEESGEARGLYRYVVRCDLTHRSTGAILAGALGSASTMEGKYVDRPRECENTVLKMAQKRALVAATLNAIGLSGRFTQDVEDLPREVVVEERREPAAEEPKPEPLTRESKVTWGTSEGTAVKDLPPDYLKWAVTGERKFGSCTAEWQDVMRAELATRAPTAEPVAA